MALDSGATEGSGDQLERTMGLAHLTAMGVGATIGTGIFFVMQVAVPEAGPAVIWSFVIAGVVAGLTALCYAELASAVPISGSSYSYAYVTLGELAAMVVAGCLLLEYGVSSAAVAVGWSEYLNQLFGNVLGLQIPFALANSPEVEGGLVNLPAVILVFCCMLLLLRGASESAWVNTIMVGIKLTVLALFIIIGFTGWNTNHLADFAPFGVHGVLGAAGTIFFSYIGLDAVSTAGEEVKDPQKTMPRALMLALVIVTGFYLLVATAAIGAQPWQEFEGQKAGLSQILENIVGAPWPGTLIAAGAVISIFSVTLVTLYGQTRILYAISRDGLAPKALSKVSPRTHVPSTSTVVVCIVVSILAGLLPLNLLAEMTSIGTLVAFTVVSIGVIVLRRSSPNLPRGFKVPGYPVTPIVTIAGCFWIISNLDAITIKAFLVWTAIVLCYYFFIGRRHSSLNAYSKQELQAYNDEEAHDFR
ncbi:APC family permease [Gephyromycinifex aptenodytis]|uniref:APC family permease n=1 Tax=Gephyromycinifex aptenodytis TaxID=2716227 RepID=UPI001447D3C8|nr:amino acid permease [Gephyromycinifex aptenodytis]